MIDKNRLKTSEQILDGMDDKYIGELAEFMMSEPREKEKIKYFWTGFAVAAVAILIIICTVNIIHRQGDSQPVNPYDQTNNDETEMASQSDSSNEESKPEESVPTSDTPEISSDSYWDLVYQLDTNSDELLAERLNNYGRLDKVIYLSETYSGYFTQTEKNEVLVLFRFCDYPPHAGGLDRVIAAVYDEESMEIKAQYSFDGDVNSISILKCDSGFSRIFRLSEYNGQGGEVTQKQKLYSVENGSFVETDPLSDVRGNEEYYGYNDYLSKYCVFRDNVLFLYNLKGTRESENNLYDLVYEYVMMLKWDAASEKYIEDQLSIPPEDTDIKYVDGYYIHEIMDSKRSDPYINQVYNNSEEGLSIYVNEASGIGSGHEKWFNGEEITVDIVYCDYFIIGRGIYSCSTDTVEYYVVDGSIYQIVTFGNDKYVKIIWQYCCGGQQPDSYLGHTGTITISCESTQDFQEINDKLQFINEIKENGECVLRCGFESYEIGEVSSEYDPFYAMIERLNLGYFIPDRSSAANTINNLQYYVDEKKIPQDAVWIEESVNELYDGNYAEKLWVLLPSDTEEYIITDESIYQKFSEGIMALMKNQAESYEITMGGKEVDGKIQQKKTITLSLSEPADMGNYDKFMLSCSPDLEINQETVDAITSFVLYESENIKESSFLCLREAESYGGKYIACILLHSRTDEIGYRYFTYLGFGDMASGGGFVYLPGEVFSGKDILGKEKDYCIAALAQVDMNKIIRIDHVE